MTKFRTTMGAIGGRQEDYTIQRSKLESDLFQRQTSASTLHKRYMHTLAKSGAISIEQNHKQNRTL